jgi:hypothetical protein
MKPYRIFINGEEVGGLYALDYRSAKAAARKLFRVACDAIG